MSKSSFEPKNGDYASLVERLGTLSADELKAEAASALKEHESHSADLSDSSFEKSITDNTLKKEPKIITHRRYANNNINTASPGQQSAISHENTSGGSEQMIGNALPQNIAGLLFSKLIKFFIFMLVIAFFMMIFVFGDSEEASEIIPVVFIFFVIIVIILSKISKRLR